MEVNLVTAIAIFIGSAVAVIFFGNLLAKYGDALASLTGMGRLFVGSILVALATSLPELSTNISAVQLVPPNPELALGNVLGANMVNMFTLAIVALIFGGKRFLQKVAPEQGYLIVLAAIISDPEDIKIPIIRSMFEEYIGCLTSEYTPVVFRFLGI